MSCPRQVGKSAALGAMYGSGTRGFQPHQIVSGAPVHALDMRSGYTYVKHDKRFGGAPVYKVTTKVISEIMRKDRVPHTELYYRDMDEIASMLPANLAAIAWLRRTKLNDLTTAVATLIMLGKEVVILRAFEP